MTLTTSRQKSKPSARSTFIVSTTQTGSARFKQRFNLAAKLQLFGINQFVGAFAPVAVRRPGKLRLAAAHLGHKLCLIGFHVGINLLTDLLFCEDVHQLGQAIDRLDDIPLKHFRIHQLWDRHSVSTVNIGNRERAAGEIG